MNGACLIVILVSLTFWAGIVAVIFKLWKGFT